MPATAEQLALLLQMALQEQRANKTPGAGNSALAQNAYFGAAPSGGADPEFQRQRTQDLQEQDKEQILRNQARLSDPYEKAKSDATVRGFETRRNVAEDLPIQPKVVKGVRADMRGEAVGGNVVAPEPRVVRGVRKFSDTGQAFTDPDAAMTTEQKARIAPSVLAAGINNESREEIARMNNDSREAVASVKNEVANQTKAAAAQAAQVTRDEVNRLAQELHDDPSLPANIGVVDARLPTIRGGSVDFQKRVDRLKALLSLENRSKLKGQGAISDKETQMLSNSATSLSQATDEAIFRKELQRIMQATSGTVPGSGGNAEFDWINGKLVPHGAAR